MKNKPFNYLLGVVVGAIWIVVIFRLYTTFFADKPGNNLPTSSHTPPNFIGMTEDSLSLLLNYEEPFDLSANVDKNPSSMISENTVIQSAPIAAPNEHSLPPISTTGIPAPAISKPIRKNGFKWESVKYKGVVASQQKVALIKYNGNTKYVKEKEKLDSTLWILEIQPDYIVLKHADSTHQILIGN